MPEEFISEQGPEAGPPDAIWSFKSALSSWIFCEILGVFDMLDGDRIGCPI